MDVTKNSIAFLMPCAGPVEPRALQSALMITNQATREGFTVTQFGISDRTIITSARNWLAKGFLDTNCEWSFWMDSDMVLEPRTIPVMLTWAKETDAKILTGIYYTRIPPHRPIIFRKSVTFTDGKEVGFEDEYEHHPIYVGCGSTKPVEVDACGFGCMLIHRSVFENPKLEYPYFRFINYMGRDGKYHESSEDFWFCIQARKLGYKIMTVPELRCGHIAQGGIIYYENCTVSKNDLTEVKS